MDYLTLGLLFIIYRKPYSCKKKLSYRSNHTPTNGFFLFIFTPMYWYIAVSKFATYKLITYIKMIRLIKLTYIKMNRLSAPIYHNFYYFLHQFNVICQLHTYNRLIENKKPKIRSGGITPKPTHAPQTPRYNPKTEAYCAMLARVQNKHEVRPSIIHTISYKTISVSIIICAPLSCVSFSVIAIL